MTCNTRQKSTAENHAELWEIVRTRLGSGVLSAPIELQHSARCALRRAGNQGAHLSYDPANREAAVPALIAACARTNQPIAADPASLALLDLSKRIALSDIPVLVEGPTGTGKEVLARYLHEASERRRGPFIAVNCAAMPEAMLEALLFGHCKGAFTGASAAGEGFFRAADGGTLLLDEIGEMPLALQSKLLRTLQEGEVVPLGATKPQSVDVRIIAATNRDLASEAASGRFREDLFYRLNVFPLRLGALRERRGDIAPLAFAMLLRHGCGKGQPAWIDTAALELLGQHPWPGNVRELENVIRRAVLLAGETHEIGAEHIQFDRAIASAASIPDAPRGQVIGFPTQRAPERQSLSDISFESEAQAILDTLEQCGGHRGKTAARLGISERTLRYRLANMREAGVQMAGAAR